MNVLVVPEDFRNDQYIIKPIFGRLLAELGKPRARVVVCNPPLLAGVTEALKSERIQEVVDRYPTADIIILCVDRDGLAGRINRLQEIENEFGTGRVFLAENAWEELETWVLAGLDLPRDWAWANVRADVSVKENYFEPLAEERRVRDGPGGGRKALSEQAARRIDSIRRKCPEDFDRLANRLEAILQQRS